MIVIAKCIVKVYDSLYSHSSEYVDLQVQLDYLYSASAATGDDGHVQFRVRQPQRQRGSEDAALFAVANTLALATGQEPEQMLLDQTKMRQHLISCLQQQFISPFPRRRLLTDGDGNAAPEEPGHVTSPSNTGEKYSAQCTVPCTLSSAVCHTV